LKESDEKSHVYLKRALFTLKEPYLPLKEPYVYQKRSLKESDEKKCHMKE